MKHSSYDNSKQNKQKQQLNAKTYAVTLVAYYDIMVVIIHGSLGSLPIPAICTGYITVHVI